MTKSTTLDLTGKRAIVTAGASGIGYAIASAILRAGGKVHVCDVDGALLAGLAKSDPALTASFADVGDPASVLGLPMRAPYVAAKWAVIGMTKTLAMELGEYGIRVNAICPGSVEGDRMERVLAAESVALNVDPGILRHNYVKHTSLRTFVSADDIANMVVFICSDLGSKISGQALSVDGHTETLVARD